MMNVRVLIGAVLTAMLFLNGCYMTKEQRWEAFDAERRQDVGVKTTAYYLTEWGKPKKRMRSQDGGEVLTWESSGYGGAEGWRKTLTFTPDGVLKDFRREYWPKEAW